MRGSNGVARVISACIVSMFVGACSSPPSTTPTDARTERPAREAGTDARNGEAGETDAQSSDAPLEDAPLADAPDGDAPLADAPDGDAPLGDAPGVDTPGGDAPGGDAPSEGFVEGCDPVAPACGAGKTCQVNCAKMATECIAGGPGDQGDPCTNNADCAPGTQCFDYGACGARICLRFCNQNAQCTKAGPGPGAFCEAPVMCGATPVPLRLCTFSCDPTGAARAAGGAGCPTGMSCLLIGSGDAVDCFCPEATRTGTEGQTCTSSASCTPGLVCNAMAGTRLCRRLCRCDAQGTACTAAKNDCLNNERCSPLTNDKLYGVCLPQ